MLERKEFKIDPAIFQAMMLYKIYREVKTLRQSMLTYGLTYPITVKVTEEGFKLRGPFKKVYVYNDGPNSVYRGINTENPHFMIEQKANEAANIDFTDSENPIKYVYFKCNEGEYANLRIEVKV